MDTSCWASGSQYAFCFQLAVGLWKWPRKLTSQQARINTLQPSPSLAKVHCCRRLRIRALYRNMYSIDNRDRKTSEPTGMC